MTGSEDRRWLDVWISRWMGGRVMDVQYCMSSRYLIPFVYIP